MCLRQGGRALLGGSKLARFLPENFSVQNRENATRFTEVEILEWLEEWRFQFGSYPTCRNGLIPGTDGSTWATVDTALSKEDMDCLWDIP